MGFTRYWEFERLDIDKFKDFSEICRILIENMNVPLDGVSINDSLVRFNGVDDDAHETFYFAVFKTGFNFCKTNLKPYDEVVFACLYVANSIFGDSIKVKHDYNEDEDSDIVLKVKSILREYKLNEILQ